jgi:hypothetical protein
MNFTWIQNYKKFICIRLIYFYYLMKIYLIEPHFHVLNYFDGDNFPIALSILDTYTV